MGAAIETESGDVFLGCNIENANFSNSLHAEVAIAEAVKNGHRAFGRIAVSSGRRDGVTPVECVARRSPSSASPTSK